MGRERADLSSSEEDRAFRFFFEEEKQKAQHKHGKNTTRKEMMLSAAFLAIAASFDAIAVLCTGDGCIGQLQRWPKRYQPGVHIFDAAQLDASFLKYGFKLKQDRTHSYLVTLSHVHIAYQMFANSSVNSFLMLEEDYVVIKPPLSPPFGVEDSAASNIAQFTKSNFPWNFLKLGYNPRWRRSLNDDRCKAACVCETVSDRVCFLKPGRLLNESCWVGSSVGYAMHRRLAAWPLVRQLGDCTVKIGGNNLDLDIDTWIAGTSKQCRNTSPVHYLFPGILHQKVIATKRYKGLHIPAMKNFSTKCIENTNLNKRRKAHNLTHHERLFKGSG